MKKQKKRRSPSIIRALNSIAFASMQNAIANKRLILTLKSLDMTYKKTSLPSPANIPFWKKWRINHILAYITVITTLAAGLMSWNKEIINTQIAETQVQKNEKIKMQQEFNKVLFRTRVLILNQNSLCKIQKRSPIELKVERRNSLENVAVLNSNIRNIFGYKASELVTSIVYTIYNIEDVCDLSEKDYEKEYDDKIKALSKNLGKIIFTSIADNNQELNKLIEKRHRLEIPIKMQF